MATEKRFTIEQTTIKECILDNTTGEQLDTVDYTERLCEVLNGLHEENERLKQLINDKTCDNTRMKKTINNTQLENYDLKEENKRLKNIIQEAYRTERTKLGKSVLKQLLEQI